MCADVFMGKQCIGYYAQGRRRCCCSCYCRRRTCTPPASRPWRWRQATRLADSEAERLPYSRPPRQRPPPHTHTTPPLLPPAALPLQFLDVGSGCGVLTACAAYLVGRGGTAVGFEVRREAVAMGKDAVRRLAATSAE